MNNVVTTYYPNSFFGWMEDFERPGISMDETSLSDTVMVRTEPENPNTFLTENSKHSGVVYLTNEKPVYSAIRLAQKPVNIDSSFFPKLVNILKMVY